MTLTNDIEDHGHMMARVDDNLVNISKSIITQPVTTVCEMW